MDFFSYYHFRYLTTVISYKGIAIAYSDYNIRPNCFLLGIQYLVLIL